jgi:hypothetical protein
MAIIIPLNPLPSQTMIITLAQQACTINVYTKFYGIFCDLFVNNSPIIQGVLCLNANYIVRSLYLGFIGDLGFFDTQGTSDPSYQELGSRFRFLYLEQSDLPSTYGLSK